MPHGEMAHLAHAYFVTRHLPSLRLAMTRTLILTSLVLLIGSAAFASDAYVVMFFADGRSFSTFQATWSGDVLLYNENPTPTDVRLLGISNGVIGLGTPSTLSLPPGEVVMLSMAAPSWVPASLVLGFVPTMWVVHMDVPDGVAIESRDEISYKEYILVEPFVRLIATGKVSMPVIRSLTPAGLPQIKLGTDIGTTTARQNIAIYNAGQQPALASIEVRRACDNSIVDTRTAMINPNTIIQVGGLTTGTNDCTITTRTTNYARYTVVTVDQPSFSIVSTLTEAQQPAPGNIAPLVELGVH
jgi:hypothetical protein